MRRNIIARHPGLLLALGLLLTALLLGGIILPRTRLARCYEPGEMLLSAALPAAASAEAAWTVETTALTLAQPLREESILVLAQQRSPAKSGEPQAVIYCTHAGEGYAGEIRANGQAGGVTRAAQALADGLEQRGIAVIVDETVHDSPSYNEAYESSLDSISAISRQYPHIELFIDVHRDSAIEGVNTRLSTENGSYARMMLVIGTDENLEHPDWRLNQAFMQQLDEELNELLPGITRKPRSSSARYNQHIAPKAILVEMGSTDNTLEEARRSAAILAQALCNVMGW